MDTSFQEVSGINKKMETEPYAEGGENRFVHQLPTKVTHTNLTLKRGVASFSSPLVSWCRVTLESSLMAPVVPQHLMVLLLNENRNPLRVWSFVNCYPVNWEVESFDSTKNQIAIEKIELSYQYFDRSL